MSLAPGMVWCKSCQARMALATAGGKCPVCDPTQGNTVAENAALELERIDSVLAGADTWEGDSEASWSADGSHQDHDHPNGFSVVMFSMPRRNNMSERARVVGQLMTDGLVHGIAEGWQDIGWARDISIVDSEDRAADFHREYLRAFTIEIPVLSFPASLMAPFWGHSSWQAHAYAVDAWEGEGGALAPDPDFFGA